MEKEIKKTTKKKVEKKVEEMMTLNPLVWELPYNADLIAQVLFIYNNNERKGSAHVKSRGDVSGGGKKPWKQKGTGRARHGSTRSPIWVGGGVTFASNERNYTRKLNKKMAKKALCIMLSERLGKGELEFSSLSLDGSKKVRSEKSSNVKTMFVTDKIEIVKALRNTTDIVVVDPMKLNCKHVVANRKIFVDKDVVKVLEDRLLNGK